MIQRNCKSYQFGEFWLDMSEQLLTRNGEIVALTPKVFDLLALLVENHGHLMDKKTLLEGLWPDSFVEEANLNVNISALRRALGERPNEQLYIETVPRRGYRFIADVRELSIVPSEGSDKSGDLAELALPGQDKITTAQVSDRIPRSWIMVGSRRAKIVIPSVAVIALLGLGFAVWKYWALPASVPTIRTIAVLPFRPLTKDQSDEALEMGIADALITKLGALDQITVRPTNAVSKYLPSDADPIIAGRELQVEAVLDGKIQRSENRIRMTVQLLRVSDGATIWTGTFDDFFTNIFAVQDSISERMLTSLALKISSREKELMQKRHTESAEAYQLFLQARYYHEKISEEGTKNALVYYRAALEKDPDYALVYASMTGAFMHLANLNIDRDVNIQAARDTAAKAVNLDPNLAEAHESLATIYFGYDWNWEAAGREFEKAIELDPKSVDAHYSYSIYLSIMKRHDEALREIETARQINPTALWIQNHVTQTLIRARRFDDAIEEARRSVKMDPNDRLARFHLVRLFLYKGMPTEAERELNDFPDFSERAKESLMAEINLQTDKRADGESVLRRIVKNPRPDDNTLVIASYYLKLNEIDKAFELLETAYQRRELLLQIISGEPDFDLLRGDPRYADFVRRMGLPE